MASSRTFGSAAMAVASFAWFVVQISSAVTLASSVAVRSAFSCVSIVRRNRKLPHQPNNATTPAMASGTIQSGCLRRLLTAHSARCRRHWRACPGFVNANAPKRANHIRLVIVGDSTVCNYPENEPTRGWGQFIQGFFNESVRVIFQNLGEAGSAELANKAGDHTH